MKYNLDLKICYYWDDSIFADVFFIVYQILWVKGQLILLGYRHYHHSLYRVRSFNTDTYEIKEIELSRHRRVEECVVLFDDALFFLGGESEDDPLISTRYAEKYVIHVS